MYLLLRLHSPRPAQAPQYWLKSSQRSQRPHAMGQCGSIQAGLLEHSDSEAQLAQYLHTGTGVRDENYLYAVFVEKIENSKNVLLSSALVPNRRFK